MDNISRLLSAVLVAAFVTAGAWADPELRNLRFHADCLDLDTGLVMSCEQPGEWDVELDHWSPAVVHAVVRQNLSNGVELGFVEDRSFDDVTAADVDGVTFSVDPLHLEFGPATVLFVRTDQDALFKLGLPSEGVGDVTLAYERIDGAAAP